MSELKEELIKAKEKLKIDKQRFSAYIFIFIIGFLTFIEMFFNNNIVALLFSLIIGTFSFFLAQKQKIEIKEIENQINDLEKDLETS